jgi:hypothetical protein
MVTAAPDDALWTARRRFPVREIPAKWPKIRFITAFYRSAQGLHRRLTTIRRIAGDGVELTVLDEGELLLDFVRTA